MGIKTINSIYKYFIILLLFLYSCTKTKNPLIGKWNLHIIENKDSTNNWVKSNWMKNGKGRLQYFNNDTVTIHFNPENYGDPGVEAYWYVASYKLNLDSNFALHTRLKHSNPDDIGKTVKRYFEINNDTLTMFAKEFGFRLKWVKQSE